MKFRMTEVARDILV